MLDADVNLNVSVRQERELWRIAQEALTNVERHARASQIEISWSRNGDLAILDITDDGQGFNTCLLYTSDADDDLLCVHLAGRRILKKKNTTIAP